eukprot:s372_g12.t1
MKSWHFLIAKTQTSEEDLLPQPASEYLPSLPASRNVYMYLTFDTNHSGRAFCGIFAPTLSEAWVCFSGTAIKDSNPKRQEIESFVTELISDVSLDGSSGFARTEVSFLNGKSLSNLVLWVEQRLKEIRKLDGGCIFVVSSQLSAAELRGMAPSCYVDQRALRHVETLREMPILHAPHTKGKFILDWPRTISKFFAKDVLLAENADSSDDAAKRAVSLRTGFSNALRNELLERPFGKKLLDGASRAPKVRVEVRATAARFLHSEAFTIGRAAECDVQATGDPTASRPGAESFDLLRSEVLPSSIPQHRTAIFVPHEERVTLLIGARTSVTLGPAVNTLPKTALATPRMTTKSIIEAQASAAKATPSELPKASVPAAIPREVLQGTPSPASASAAPATASPNLAPAAAGMCSKSINATRTTLRQQQLGCQRERLRGRVDSAALPPGLRATLEAHLSAPSETALQEIRDVLDGFGAPPAPDETCRRLLGAQSGPENEGMAAITAARGGHKPLCPDEGASQLVCSLRCGAAVKRPADEKARKSWLCHCGAPPVCTACGSTPYHYHGSCKEVRQLRKRWLEWAHRSASRLQNRKVTKVDFHFTMGEPFRKVVVCTPSGRLIEVDFKKEGTVQALKEQLQSQVGESPARMILLCGDKVLQDDCKLDDTGSSSGLTLVMSSLPTGCFELFSGDEGPAGENTTADVTAEFESSGAFRITIKETEITSDDEDEDYDEYEAGAAWDHEYTGMCVVDGHELKLAISGSKRKGRFDGKLYTEFQGTLGSAYHGLQRRAKRKATTQQRALREAMEIGSQQTADSQDDQATVWACMRDREANSRESSCFLR